MRPFRTALLLPLILVSLAGCTPSDLPLAALALRDGEPTVLLVVCGSDTASIHLYEDVSMSSASPATSATTDSPEWSIDTDQAEPVNEIPLLDATPPSGWAVESSTLDRVEPGVWYRISAYQGSRAAFKVRFDTEALDKLDGEHVLAPVSYREQEVMTRDRFERNARKACEEG